MIGMFMVFLAMVMAFALAGCAIAIAIDKVVKHITKEDQDESQSKK